MRPPNSLQKFLRDSGVKVVRTNATPKRVGMDPFKTPPSSPSHRLAVKASATPSPLVLRKRALSLSPRPVTLRRVVSRVAATPSPSRTKKVVIRSPPRSKVSARKLSFEPLRFVMATAVNRHKRVAKPDVDIAGLLKKKPHARREPLVVSGKHYKIETTLINGRDRQNKVVFTRAQSGKTTGTASRAKSVEYAYVVTAPNGAQSKGSLYVYASGNLRISGAVPLNDVSTFSAIHRYLIYTYTGRQKFLYAPLKFSNVTGQFRGNFVVNMDAFQKYLRTRKIKFRYEPELQQYFFLIDHDKHTFMVRRTGLVQLFKAENPNQLQNTYRIAKELLMSAHQVGMLIMPTGYTEKFHSPPPSKKRAIPDVVSTPTVTMSTNGTVCIDGRSCKKLKKTELLAYAKKLNVALPKHVLKPAIIKKIGNLKSSPGRTNSLQNIRAELFNQYYDKRLLKNAVKKSLFKKRLDEDTRKIKALLNRIPARHRTDTGEVKKTVRDVIFREVASDTKGYVELSIEIDRVLKEEMLL
jgi:hypothetical protein